MSVPVQPQPQSRSQTATTTTTAPPSEAAAKLTDAIDDFLGDVEKKFKNISDEILTKLDDMAERCDRLEQEMLMRDGDVGGGAGGIDTRSKSTLKSGESMGGDGNV